VKCKFTFGCCYRKPFTKSVLWVEKLSRMTCTSRSVGRVATTSSKNVTNP
jgi:hypothetical protein